MSDLGQRIFQTDIRKVCLVGPSFKPEREANPRYLWVAHLTALYDEDATAYHGAMRNPSLRVLAEAAEARAEFKVEQTKKVTFHDPKLLSVAIRPQVGWWSSLFFDALPSGQMAKAISGSIGNRREEDAFSVVTAVPALAHAQTPGKWPDKTNPQLQIPPLRLTAGAIPIFVTQETDKQHKNKVGYWTLLQATKDGEGFLSLFGKQTDGTGIFVSATPGAFKVLRDGLDIADDEADPNSKESGDSTEKAWTDGKPPRFAADLTPDGIEFDAKLRFPGQYDVNVRLRLEARVVGQETRFVLVLLEDKASFFRKGLDQVAADLRRNGHPVALDLRPGTPRIVWALEYKNDKLTLPDVRAFTLEPDSVRISLLGDPPSGATGRTVARLSNPQASVTWGGLTPSKINFTAGDYASNATPVAVLDVSKNPKRFEFLLGDSNTSANPTGDVAVVVDASAAGSPGSVFLALERGVTQLPRPSEKFSIPTAGETNAFEGLVHLKSASVTNGVSTVTVDAATRAEVIIAYAGNAVSNVQTTLYGAVGVLDGYVWAAVASPSGEEIVPTLDNGPISLRSMPVLFGARGPVQGYKGTIAPVTGQGAVKVTIEAPKPTDIESPNAVIWAPHPKTMTAAGPKLPPVVAAVSMTRTLLNATEPSRTRDLVPVAYEPKPGHNVLKLTLSIPKEGSGLPFCAADGNVMLFGWPGADVPLAAVTLPGVEYAATDAATPTLRFDLPLLDDFHGSATPRRKREEDGSKKRSEVTADTRKELAAFWSDQSRRRRLMRSADDIFWNGTAAGSVAMPFAMSDTVVFEVKNGSTSKPLPLGAYKINNDDIQFGEGALAGLSANYGVKAANSSKLERNSNGPIKIVGFASAPYEVKIGGTRPDKVKTEESAWQDTRGHAFAKTFSKTSYAILRQTHYQSTTDVVEPRTLITSLQATEVQIDSDVKAFLAFRDLPTVGKDGELGFMVSNELPADPYSREDLPSSVYEWRHYEVTDEGKPAAHDIGFGPLRLKPLRLKNARFSPTGICKQAEVEYRVDLEEPSDGLNSDSKVPYGPDDLYRTGSVFSATYVGDDGSATLKTEKIYQANEGEVRVDFRVTAEPLIGTTTGITVDVSFGLEVKNGCLVIVENSGELKLKLFGSDRDRIFDNAKVTLDKGKHVLAIEAERSDTTTNGLAIKRVRLVLSRDSTKLDIDAILSTAPVGANPALVLHIGKTVNFYGTEIKAQEDAFKVDYATGVVSVNLSNEQSKPVTCAKALARGFPVSKTADGSMVFVLDKPDSETASVQPIGAARADLHIQSESDFDARFLMQVENNEMTRQRLTVTLGIQEANSVISWPIGAIDGDNDASKAVVKELMSATSLAWKTPDTNGPSMVTVKVAPTEKSVVHKVRPTLKIIDVAENALQFDPGTSEWVLDEPVRVKAVTQHLLGFKKGNASLDPYLSWTAIDDVTLIDVDRFVALATEKEPKAYAFSPRYLRPQAGTTDGIADPEEVPIAGIVKTAPFGRAIGNYLQKNTGSFEPGLALVGGAVHEAVLRKDVALTFGLPWIRFLNCTETPGSSDPKWPLPSIPQAPEKGASKKITVSLFDLAAAVPHQRNGAAPYPIAVSGQRVVDLMSELKRLQVDPAIRVADLAFASNLPAYPNKAADKKDPVIPDIEAPIFWRTLMALKRLFEGKNANGDDVKPQSFITVFGDPTAERAVRIDLVAGDVANGVPKTGKARVFVLDRTRVEVSDLPATLAFETVNATDAQRRVLLDARTAIADPLAVKVARAVADELQVVKVLDSLASEQGDKQDDKQEVDLAMEHHEDGFAIDPKRRQPITAGCALRPEKAKTVHPEPSLGWPEFGQLGDAAVSSLSIGEEAPLQDSSVAWAGRARRFGGMLVAAAGEKVPASPTGQASEGFHKAFFLAVGRRVVFARDAGAGDLPTVTAPPDRALTPVPPRARAPVPDVIERAFAGDFDKIVANFLPGHYEFVSTGVRPGAMVFEHTGVLRASNALGFDPDHKRFGRPAERAPVVWTQGRAPRSTGLPRGDDLDLRRRTFIGENILDGENMRELALIEGPAGVIRYLPSSIEEGGDSAFAKKTVAIFIRVNTKLTEFDPKFAGGKIELVYERPLPTADENSTRPLSEVLVELGFLQCNDRVSPVYSLTIGDVVACAAPPKFDNNDKDVKKLTVTIAFDAGFGAIRQSLVSATPDTRALLHILAGVNQSPNGGTQLHPLLPRPPRTLSIRLPVLPAVEPYLPIPTATLAFGDPAYDRELAGPAKTQVRRHETTVSILSLDRPAYDVGETVHFAAGDLNPAFLDPASLKEAIPPTAFKSPEENTKWSLRIEWLPKPVDDRPSKAIPLTIADTKIADEEGPTFEINSGSAYGVSIAALRMTNGAKPAFKDGDRLSFTVKKNNDPDLTVAVTIVDEPVIAPSPAVYSLVTLDTVDRKEIATPILYSSAPLPTTLEFPDLLTDLARGHVRRRGLFVWRFVPRTAKPAAALVKIDRTGGGQIPSEATDFFSH
jgi:hypothetical protein